MPNLHARVFSLVLACGGCSAQEPVSRQSIGIRTDRTSYTPPAVVSFTLVNRADRTLFLDPCSATLERRINKEWSAEDPRSESGDDCPATLVQLPAGDSATHELTVGAAAPEGTYRGTFTVMPESGEGEDPSSHSSPTFVLFAR